MGQLAIRPNSTRPAAQIPTLKPTTANSWAAGFVYTPKAFSGLSLTVDYSDITEKQIVGTVPANTIIQSVETIGTSFAV